MVGERNLCAHNAVDENEIPLYAAAEGGGWVAVGAGEHIAVHALFRQGMRLGIKRFQAAGDAVRSEKPYDGGDASGGKIRQAGFRRAGGKAVLTAAARDVNVQINESGDERFACRVDRLQRGKARRDLPAGSDEGDLSALEQYVAHTQVAGGVNVCILD